MGRGVGVVGADGWWPPRRRLVGVGASGRRRGLPAKVGHMVAVGRLVARANRHREQRFAAPLCPDHQTVRGIMMCARCAGLFWAMQGALKRRELERDNATAASAQTGA